MKRASNKSNLSIIKDYVEGNRPFVQVSLSGVEELANKKEGDEWVDLSGKKWKKVNGTKKYIPKKASIINEERCILCNADVRWGNRYDHQVWPKTRKCYDCFIEFETLLKAKGLHNNFVRNRDLLNLKGKLLEFKSKLIESIVWCNDINNKEIKYVNDDGSSQVEVWKDDTDIRERIKVDAENDLKLVNDRLKDIENELKTLIVDMKSIKKIEKEFIKKYKKGRPHVYRGVIQVTNTK
jgi:hypothetical protein